MMNKMNQIYEGKAKKVFATENDDFVIVEYKDDATAFNGQKKGTIVGKGVVNNKVSNHFFKLLENNGVPTHYVEQLSDRETVVKKVEIVPVEVIIRNKAAGSFTKRVGVEEGTQLKCTILEYSYKNDDLGDPLINSYYVRALGLATDEEMESIKDYSFKINEILTKYLKGLGIELIDFKLEFGRFKGDIILADEISPDTCRFWDIKTGKKLDKDRFRRDLGDVEEAYQEVISRLMENSMPHYISKLGIYQRLKPHDDCMHEECGVFGIYRSGNSIDAAEAAYYGLFALQHRGQESAGIAVAKDGKINYHKDMGLVTEVFKNGLEPLMGAQAAIGHVRYSTTGDSLLANAQPLVISSKKGQIALAHNGNLVNAMELREGLENDGAIFQTSIDSEVIASLIAKHRSNGIVEAIKKTMGLLKGSYALVIMTPDQVIGVRDPKGIRPIALGKIDNSYVFASESCAFDTIGAEFIRDLRPGEIVTIDKNGLKSCQGPRSADSALCIFEYVYFARSGFGYRRYIRS